MRILALVKYSLDAAEIRVQPTTGALRLANVPQRFGDIDKNVVEAAVRLKERVGGSVSALCVGPRGAVAGLKSIMGMGVDDAIVVVDPFDGAADARVVTRIIEAAIDSGEPFDLVVCGFASDDGYTWQIGPRLAERLALPFVSYVSDIRSLDHHLEVDQDLGDRVQTVSVPLPAILAVAEESFPPRSVTLLDAMKAQKRPVRVCQVEDGLGVSVESLEQASLMRETSRIGIVVPRKQEMLTGESTVELADRFIEALIHEGVLKEDRS